MTYRQAPTHWLKFYDDAVIESEARTAIVQLNILNSAYWNNFPNIAVTVIPR